MRNSCSAIVFFDSSYVKLQQAYFSEMELAGGWTLIGYTAPSNGSSTNFTYGGEIADSTTDDLSAAKVGFFAAGKVNLNECKVASPSKDRAPWRITISKDTSGTQADIAFKSTVEGDGCKALTPSFETIGK